MNALLARCGRYLAVGLLLLGSAPSLLQAGEPSIRAITPRPEGVEVTIHVPAGVRRLTLETRSKLGSGAWVPRQSRWHDGSAADLLFRLAGDRDTEMLRIRAEETSDLPLPATFYQGTNRFDGAITTNTAPPQAVRGPGDALAVPMNPTEVMGDGATLTTREVVESDIWQVKDQTVYFFNSARGFQVIDLANPDQPVLRATLPLAARGEQMYLLPAVPGDTAQWVALLTTDWCSTPRSEVHLVRVQGTQATFQTHLPVAGRIVESRLVGTALYLASTDGTSRPLANGGSEYVTETVVTAYNLAQPTSVPAPSTHRFEASPNAIMATDRFLFVATTGPSVQVPIADGGFWYEPGSNSVAIIDISDPAGAIVPRGTFATRGRVQDKFKLHLDGDILTVVSQAGGVWAPSNPARPGTSWTFRPQETWLETFSLAAPASPVRAGELRIIVNESLFATRFVGDRAYVVTFRQIDPLWIIDLSNPATPTIKGELQIPGYSSYLQPLGTDRLIAMGVEQGNATVALFDVRDEAKPVQLSKVFLGTGWSWSEANSDEKAFRVFADRNLVLVPWQGQEGDQWVQAMQLIDLGEKTLVKRGVIHHAAQARRATLLGDRLVSVSASELLTVNIADRDRPAITSDLELGFRVDRILALGDRLIQYSAESLWNNTGANPLLRMVSQASPDQPLGILSLARLNLVGWDLEGTTLHLLQHQPDTTVWEPQVTTVTNTVLLPVPPLIELRTNTSVVYYPQPPLVTYRTVTNVLVYPLLPTDPPGTEPRVETNIYTVRIETPVPPRVETNTYVAKIEVPLPPRPESKITEVTNQVPVTVPGYLLASTVDCTGPVPILKGSLQLAPPKSYWGSTLVAFHPQPGLVVWTEAAADAGYYPWWDFMARADVVPARASAARAAKMAPAVGGVNDLITFPIAPIGRWAWGLPYYGTSVRNLIALETVPNGAPLFRSRRVVESSGTFSSFSPVFEAGGRLHFSERLTLRELQPDPTNDVPVKEPFPLLWQPEIWKTSHQLHVFDYADPEEPTAREPIALPGTLAGVAHGGSLLVTRGDTRWDTNGIPTTPVSALGYDGLTASLIATLEEAGLQLHRVEPDGQAAATVPGKAGEPARLQLWAVATDAAWHRYADLPAPAGVNTVSRFGNTLVAAGDASLQFYQAPGGENLTSLGSTTRPCSLWFDWTATDLSAGPVLWIPRGEYGVTALKPE